VTVPVAATVANPKITPVASAVAGPAPSPVNLPTVPPALFHQRPMTDAHEVLILSYTSDLQFFESTCLADALASTGRVTVVRDADKGIAAAEARLAGSSYVDVPVCCKSAGAFHPKLVVLASPERAIAAIGSGNMTASGWHYNAEMWTVLSGADEHWPAAFGPLAQWLQYLPDCLHIDAFGAARIRAVAALLAGRVYAGGPQLVHNLTTPIVEQLERGPVSRLGVASPFLDGACAALTRLQARFEPEVTNVALTRGASFEAGSLADALAGPWAGAAASIGSAKYHHGKVMTWDRPDGTSWVLMGSANCTAAAMLTTTSQMHGNCELGLLVDVTGGADLMPPVGEPLDRDALTVLADSGPPLPTDRATAAPFLARALREPGGLRLTVLGVSRPFAGAAELLWDGGRYPIGAWGESGHDGFAACLAPGGALVTVVFADELASTTAAVTDPFRVMQRLEKPSPLEDHNLEAVFRSPELAGEMLEAFQRLAAARPPASPAVAGDRQRTPGEWLEAWTMAASAAVGQSLVSLALGQPTPAAADSSDVDQALKAAEREGGAGVGIPNPGGVDNIAAGIVPPTEAELAQAARTAERYRSRVVKLILSRCAAATDWNLTAQQCLLRVLTLAISGGLFTVEDWTPAVADLAVAIADPVAVDGGAEDDADAAAIAKALLPYRTALAVVCLAMIRCKVTTWTSGDIAAKDFARVQARLPQSAADVDAGLVMDYALGLDKRLGVTLSGPAIVDALGYLLDAGSLARLAEAQSTETVSVEVAGSRTLQVHGPGDPRSLALRVLAKAQAEAPVVVACDNAMSGALFAWFPPFLVEVITHPAGSRGRLMRPAFGLGPVQNGSAAVEEKWTGALPEGIRERLEEVGLDHPFQR